MPIIDLYKHSESRRNLAHFAAMASLAAVDGEISKEEKKILDHFAAKLGITKEEYKEVMKKENKYPIETPMDRNERFERLHDFQTIKLKWNKGAWLKNTPLDWASHRSRQKKLFKNPWIFSTETSHLKIMSI